MAGDPSSPDAPRIPRVPDHELLKPIGRGSYGDVWLARSVGGQLRAVKVVWRGHFSSDRPYEREFSGIRQFEPISRSHPGVIPILHLGRDEAAGCFYYIMELADARDGEADYAPRTLASDLKARTSLPLAEALALGVQLADALGHLHRHHLVHRDVKPSNIIFVGEKAKLADIGLVTGADEAESFVGTEGFIPPEGPGTAQADIFGLGRVLYEAATGKDRCDFPELPDDLPAWEASAREGLLELNEILTRACAPNAPSRYANAAELAADLNLVLAGRSIRRAHGVERRLRRVTQVLGIAVAVALVASVAFWLQQDQRRRAEARANEEAALRERAERAEDHARLELRESRLHQALALLSGNEPDRRTRALAQLREAAAIGPGLDLRNAALAALATPELRVVRRWNPRTREASESRPDSRLQRYALRNRDGSVSVVSMENDAELLRLPTGPKPVAYVSFSPDDRWLAVMHHDQELRVWNLASRTAAVALPVTLAFAFTPDSSEVVALCGEAHVHRLHLASGRERLRAAIAEGASVLAVHPEQRLFLVSSQGRSEIEIRRLEDGGLERSVSVPPLGLVAGWSADGKSLLTAHADFSIRVWDWPAVEAPRLILRSHQAEPIKLATDQASRWLVTAGWDSYVQVIDLERGQVVLREPAQLVHAAVDRPAFLLQNVGDWQLVEFDPAYGFEAIPVHEAHKSPRDVAFDATGRWLASAGTDGIRVLDRLSHEVSVLTREDSLRVAFRADGTRLHAVTPTGLRGWRMRLDASGRLRAYPLHLPGRGRPPFRGPLAAGIFAGGESWLAAQRDPRDGQHSWIRGRFDSPEVEAPVHSAPGASGPEVSHDGRWLAWGNWQLQDAVVIRLGSREAPFRLPAFASATVAFSPDDRLLVVGGSEEIRFYEVGTWRPVHTIPRRPIQPLPPTFAFTRDSRLCAAALPPDRVLLLDTQTGAELATLPVGQHVLGRVAFSPDDRFLAAASTDHHVLLWDLEKIRGKLRELGLDW